MSKNRFKIAVVLTFPIWFFWTAVVFDSSRIKSPILDFMFLCYPGYPTAILLCTNNDVSRKSRSRFPQSTQREVQSKNRSTFFFAITTLNLWNVCLVIDSLFWKIYDYPYLVCRRIAIVIYLLLKTNVDVKHSASIKERPTF